MRVLPASEEAINEAIAVLRAGGIVAHATETCYGLACDLTNEAAVERLFALKRRPADQPVSALFPSVEEAKKYTEWNEKAEELAQKYLPGPLTIILPVRNDAPHLLYLASGQRSAVSDQQKPSATSYQLPATSSTVGIRISSHALAHALARGFGRPLSTTSANVHGEREPYSVSDIRAQYDGRSPLLVPTLTIDSGTLPAAPPSTIVEILERRVHVRRRGAFRVA